MSVCDFNLGGRLHKKLKKKYPESLVDGVSSYYIHLRTDPEFLDQFGDWTNIEENARMQELLIETGVFNDQGEPQLHVDSIGPYVLLPGKDFMEGKSKVISGDSYYLNDTSVILSSKEYSDGINTMSGAYISAETDKSPEAFVEEFIGQRIGELVKKENELSDSIENLSDPNKVVEAMDALEAVSLNVEKLNNILTSTSALAAFTTRVNDHISTQNFKIKVIGDKVDEADQDTHEDILSFTLDSNEISNRAGADLEILKFLSSIPVYKDYNKVSSKQEKVMNPLFGGPQYMNQAAAWSMVEEIVADIIVTGPGENLFQSYLDAIKFEVSLSEHKQLNHVYTFLNNLDTNVEDVTSFKTKFKQAMHKSTVHYVYTQVESNTNQVKLNVIDPAIVNDKVGKIANNIIETPINIEGRSEKNFASIKQHALVDFKKIMNSGDVNRYESFLHNLLVEKLQIPLENGTIKRLVATESNFAFSDLNNLINKFISTPISDPTLPPLDLKGEMDIMKELMSRSRKHKEEYKAFLLRPSTFIKALARYDSIYKNKNSEATVFIGGKQRWLYSFVSQMQMELQKIKRGLSNRLEQLKDKKLVLVDHMIKAPEDVQHVEVITNTELKKKNDPNPVQHKRITAVDLHLDNLVKMFYSKTDFYGDTVMRKQGKGAKEEQRLVELQNYLIYNFGADKNSLFALSGLPNPIQNATDIYNIEKKELGADFKRILRGYIEGEIQRIKKDSEVVATYMANPNVEFLMENLIPGYHYNSSKDVESEDLTAADFQAGQYYKMGIFTTAFDTYLENNFKKVFGINKGKDAVPIIRDNFLASKNGKNSDFDKLMAVVFDEVNTAVKDNYESLNNMVLTRAENKEGDIVTKNLFDVSTNVKFGGNKDLAIYSYIASSFITAYELSNLFNGHISFYKQKGNENINLDDFLKRGAAPATNGQYLLWIELM